MKYMQNINIHIHHKVVWQLQKYRTVNVIYRSQKAHLIFTAT